MMRIFEALAGYILAVFAAAFVIVISVTPVMSWFGAGAAGVQSGLLDLGIFWISAALRIAIVAFIPALIGMIIANTTGRRSTLFYCLWAIATAIGLSLLTNEAPSFGSLLTLAAAGLAAGLAYRAMNRPARQFSGFSAKRSIPEPPAPDDSKSA